MSRKLLLLALPLVLCLGVAAVLFPVSCQPQENVVRWLADEGEDVAPIVECDGAQFLKLADAYVPWGDGNFRFIRRPNPYFPHAEESDYPIVCHYGADGEVDGVWRIMDGAQVWP